MALQYNWLASSGNVTGSAAGTVVGGNSVSVANNYKQKVDNLSALVTVDAETDTLTFAFKWQVSNDNSTWVDVANGSQNAAAVVLATGSGGADASVTKSIPAPDSLYGWKWARAALVTGGTTGATVDTYAISYACRTL